MRLDVGFVGVIADWMVRLWSFAYGVEDVAHSFEVVHNPSFPVGRLNGVYVVRR